MNGFGWAEAWARGYRFVTVRPFENAVLLIGLALLLPLAVQYAVIGGMAEPQGTGALIGLAVNYVLQSCALFAVLRLGLDERETFGGALGYGLVASLVAAGTVAVLVSVALMIGSLGGPPGAMPFVILAVLVPFAVALATYSTLIAATIGTGLVLALATTMILGATTGNVGLAATLAGGGSGLMVVLLLLLSAALVWAAARLTCTAAHMADHRSLNVIAALRASWALTSEEQGRITLYLAIVSLGFVLVLAALLAAAGGSIFALQDVMTPTAAGASAMVLGFVAAIPLSYLTVLVPVGIYLRLAGERAPVEVFA
ncbi:hypothetical protein RCO27_04450 [Sphingosinicella sp. LHD-64]|uniref:hypothetical protein n=1 Tax=Sphingosinicella sp. LHD-64 TaxID=3072139 RepID=UPI00280F099F|nr:hypothetical protein [Sphingosinicella sp. LHD-64]MDQ8755472.1 hypothetical protein [Sphingosinicella sp. LHD-64]